MTEMASAAGMTGSYFTPILRLSFLAPAISRAILHGRQPAGLNARKFMADTRPPVTAQTMRKTRKNRKLGHNSGAAII